MNPFNTEVHQSMFIVDGGPDAELPPGTRVPVLAGPEAIFVAGRIEFDAPTVFRMGPTGGERDLVHAYTGEIATPQRALRVVTIDGEVLGQVSVPQTQTRVSIYVTDFDEPDEIYVAVELPSGLESGPESP